MTNPEKKPWTLDVDGVLAVIDRSNAVNKAVSVFDGRMFGWQRSDMTGLSPVIIWDKAHGCSKNFEIIGLKEMQPDHYRLSLSTLTTLYPVPTSTPAQQE